MTLRKRPQVSWHNKAPYKRLTERKIPVLTEWEAQQLQPEGTRTKKRSLLGGRRLERHRDQKDLWMDRRRRSVRESSLLLRARGGESLEIARSPRLTRSRRTKG